MCSLKTCDYNNVYFTISFCWLTLAFAVEWTVLAQLQTKPDGDMKWLKNNHFFPLVILLPDQCPNPVQNPGARSCQQGVGSV